MSDEFKTVKDIATHPATGTGIAGILSFLIHKVWRGHRHEIASMKSASVHNAAAIVELDKKFDEHIQRDHDVHTELLNTISRNHKEVLEHLINLKGRL